MAAVCIIPNCGKPAVSKFAAFCRKHCDDTPCGECHLRPGERCDICGAREPHSPTKEERS